ncbi:uncharacterized protein LOC115445493 isoform X2 [Manduca sexta]|uniref:Uncharacterized protein n=1 Tax=Manduca sexta TaxID=7130 RepID=A0A921YL61_MANSE|nr:uncharacterized protein LOC115445493 isoform X2 [Manduca sexta]KAG6441435.1 hypothetical protein O3G_MSEX001819 [Manduca sexta]
MLFAPIAVEAMKCKEENCEVGVVLEHNSLIVLSVNKTIVCLCGRDRNNPFERGKLRKREEHSASVHPAEVLQAAPAPQPEPLAFRQQPLWQFPPPLPPPYVYPHDQDNLMQPHGNERASFRSLRKNIGGRWKRLVKKKPEQEVYTIPPELKPQLKQIYVY